MRETPLPGFTSATLFTAATRPITGTATAFHLDGDRFGTMHHLLELSISEEVLEAKAAEAVPTGSNISLGFETPGLTARRGEVVNCDPCDEGWRVGIRMTAA